MIGNIWPCGYLYGHRHVSPDVVRSAAHLQSARESTDQGFVLLQNPVQSDENSQNSHVLPFEVSKSTVVIGPMSTSRQFIVGNYLGVLLEILCCCMCCGYCERLLVETRKTAH